MRDDVWQSKWKCTVGGFSYSKSATDELSDGKCILSCLVLLYEAYIE